MIQVFYGEDRVRAKNEITRLLGQKYEVYDGAELSPKDLPNIFLGNSLFGDTRSILIRDFLTNKDIADKLSDYLNTSHDVILFELKLDKRSTIYKDLKNQLSFKEFSLPKNPDQNLVFEIFRIAKTDGKKSLNTLSKIKSSQDPMMFFGLLVSQALKDYSNKQGNKEKRVLKELSKLDLNLKTTSYEPWLLIESFLLQLSSL